MVGQIVLWVFLGLLLLLVLLLVLPAVLYIEYKDKECSLKLRVLPVKLRLLPAKSKNSEKERQKKARKEQRKAKKEAIRRKKLAKTEGGKQEKTEKTKRTLGQTLAMVQQLIAAASPAAKFVFGHLRIKDVALVLPVHGEDAAETATRFGQMQGVVFGIYAALQNVVKISYRQLFIIPDFMGQSSDALSFSCKMTAPPIIMLVAAGMALKRYSEYGRQEKQNYRLARQQMMAKKRAAARRRKEGGSAVPMKPAPAPQEAVFTNKEKSKQRKISPHNK